ncbi:MAG: hypothetical protein AAF092_14830 [Pseudomonadota bacterium]
MQSGDVVREAKEWVSDSGNTHRNSAEVIESIETRTVTLDGVTAQVRRANAFTTGSAFDGNTPLVWGIPIYILHLEVMPAGRLDPLPDGNIALARRLADTACGTPDFFENATPQTAPGGYYKFRVVFPEPVCSTPWP